MASNRILSVSKLSSLFEIAPHLTCITTVMAVSKLLTSMTPSFTSESRKSSLFLGFVILRKFSPSSLLIPYKRKGGFRWKRRDVNAETIIKLASSDEHLGHNSGLKTATNMGLYWKNLPASYSTQKIESAACILFYRNGDWRAHLGIGEQGSSVKVEDEDKATSIFCGLPDCI